MPDLLLPFSVDFMQHALLGGSLVAVVCAVVGTWVVVRGMAFLGEALGHGMLPGVALATVLGFPAVLGGASTAIVMSLLIGVIRRRSSLSFDTTIGLLFVSMLSIGVIIVSHSRSFATDATVVLFGDVLAIDSADLLFLGGALAVVLVVAALCHHGFVAVAFDPRIALALGYRPGVFHVVLTGLVTVAVVAGYQAVGSLLVVGLLLAPAVAASRWTHRIPTTMALAAVLGILGVTGGLWASWCAGTAAGASIVCAVIGIAILSALGRGLVRFAGALRRAGPAGSTAARSAFPAASVSAVPSEGEPAPHAPAHP